MKRIALAAWLLTAPAPVAAGAATLYGVDVPGNVFAIDLGTGVGTLVGVLPDGPYANPDLPGYNEIEYDSLRGRAWAQQRDGNFAAQEFDLETGAGVGAPVPNGASWHGLEFVGPTLYGASFTGIASGDLATLDPETGTSTFIGSFDLAAGRITGLAFDVGTGTMYGIDGGGGGGGVAVSTLYAIDLATGAATPIGPTGITAGSLEFGPDGRLYAGGVGADRGNLYWISPASGRSTLVGATGFGTGVGNGLSGLTTAPEPTLYGIDVPGNLFAIDLATGAGWLVGVLPDGPYADVDRPGYNEIEYEQASGRAWAQQRHGNQAAQEFEIETAAGVGAPVSNGASFHGLEYVDDVLFAAGFDSPDGFLATLDPETGSFAAIGSFGLAAGQITGLAFDTRRRTLYGIDGGGGGAVSESSLYTIDLETGAARSVGGTGITAGSLEFGPDGVLYAGGVGGNRGNLYRIDPSDGSSSFVGATGFGIGEEMNGISGLTTLPEPSHPLLVALATLAALRRPLRPRRR